jgi:5'-nucleotidase
MICSSVYSGTAECDPQHAPAGATLVPREFEGKAMQPAARVTSIIQPYLERVASKRDEKVGIRTTAPFKREYLAESSIGNLVTDALREGMHTDLGFMNSGAIRVDLPQGELTYADIFAVSPFDNYPAVVEMTGRQVVEMLGALSGGARGIMQVSGLHYVIDAKKDADKPPNERDRVVSVTMPDGSPFDLDRTYKVAMPDFLSGGGDGTQDVMAQIPPDRIHVSFAQPVRDLVMNVIRKRPQPIAPVLDGRVKVLK